MDKKTLDAFCEFAKYADLKLFIKIYGERLGNHFWDKHTILQNRNMTWTYNDMDNEHRSKLINYLTELEKAGKEKEIKW